MSTKQEYLEDLKKECFYYVKINIGTDKTNAEVFKEVCEDKANESGLCCTKGCLAIKECKKKKEVKKCA